ncbi:MAG: hypothetical protein HY070_02015 [Chloroflexi bacterium]|nr:hypothetical protein [Chloroflexota bacterium]
MSTLFFLQRWLALAISLIVLSLACRTSDLIANNNDEPPSAASAATLRPTFTPAAIKTLTQTATRPRATATRVITARPTFTSLPQPIAPPAPTATPPGPYFRVSAKSCASGGDTRIIGTVYDSGNKVNGLTMRVAAVPSGPPAINDFITGKDPTDPKRVDSALQGQYRLALYEGQQKKGNWFVFIINNAGDVLSENGNIQTTDGAGCNIGTVDFAH